MSSVTPDSALKGIAASEGFFWGERTHTRTSAQKHTDSHAEAYPSSQTTLREDAGTESVL